MAKCDWSLAIAYKFHDEWSVLSLLKSDWLITAIQSESLMFPLLIWLKRCSSPHNTDLFRGGLGLCQVVRGASTCKGSSVTLIWFKAKSSIHQLSELLILNQGGVRPSTSMAQGRETPSTDLNKSITENTHWAIFTSPGHQTCISLDHRKNPDLLVERTDRTLSRE